MDLEERHTARKDYERAIQTLEKIITCYPKSSLNHIYYQSIEKYRRDIRRLYDDYSL